MKTQTLSKTLLTLSVLAFSIVSLSGCGATKTGTADLASVGARNTPGNDDNSDSANAVVAECTSIQTNTSNIEGRITSFYHPTSNEYLPTYMRLKLDRLPVEITTTNTHYIQLFKWYADSANKKMYAAAPVGFFVQNRTTKEYLNTAPLKTISKAAIQNLITNKKLGESVTLNNFFEKYILILEGLDLKYDAVSFAVYNSAQGSKALATNDVLLPAFAVNPNVYASTHPQTVLQKLHPFWADRANGYSDEQLKTASLESCIPN